MYEENDIYNEALPTQTVQKLSEEEAEQIYKQGKGVPSNQESEESEKCNIITLETEENDQSSTISEKLNEFKFISLLKYVIVYVLLFVVIQNELKLNQQHQINNSIKG